MANQGPSDPGAEPTLDKPGATPAVPPAGGPPETAPAPPAPGALFADRYRLVREVGRGGMGRVLAARDLRLGREVAIKLLAGRGAGVSFDEQQLRRFEQEARAAGALNHPNIVAVHDVGWSAGAPYIVSELLQGATLRHRLGRKALPVRWAVDYALQLALGLAAAHDKGVVHRDLKPENLFVTSEGRLKILDFGIAKLLLPEAPARTLRADEDAAAPPRKTETGALVGTVGYMSPEQVRGEAADLRTDLFSAGVVLYEMLAGARPFERSTPLGTVTATLHDEPPELPERVPAELDRIVRRALEKDPADRYPSAKDLALDLEAVAARPLAPGRRRRWRRALGVLALVALAGAAAFLAGRRAGEKQAPGFRPLTFRRGHVTSALFAPDGQTVVYSAAWEGSATAELFSARLQSGASAPLGLQDAHVLAISPGEEMLVRRGDPGFQMIQGMGASMLVRVALSGGAPREVMEAVGGADWAPDGQALAVVRDVAGRRRLELPPGKVLYETTGAIGAPRFSRNGDLIAFLDFPVDGDDAGSVAVIDRAGKKRTLAGGFGSADGLAWSPSGEEVWFTAAADTASKALRAVTLSGRQRVLAQVPGSLKLFDVDRSGRVLVAHQTIRRQAQALAPGESRERELSWFDYSQVGDLSSDGKTLLFQEGGLNGGVFVRKTDGSPAVRLGDGDIAASLSPDGKWALTIADLYSEPSAPRLVALPVGPGEPRPVPVDGMRPLMATWFPDGNRILLDGEEPGHRRRLYVLPLAGGAPRAITPEGAQLWSYAVSPDGKLVAARVDYMLALYPVEGGAPTPIPEVRGRPIRWSADGRSLYLHRFPCSLHRLDLETRRTELLRTLAPPDPVGFEACSLIRVTPDGRSYAYHYQRLVSTLYLLEGLR